MLKLLVSSLFSFIGKYKLYVYAAILTAGLLSGTVAYYKLKIAALTIDYENQLDDKEQTIIEMDRQANAEIARLNQQADIANQSYVENLKHAQTQINQLNSDLATNKRVFSSKVKACVQTSKTDNSGAVTTETRAELDSETARSLVGITSRCDEITLQLNALIDAIK